MFSRDLHAAAAAAAAAAANFRISKKEPPICQNGYTL
jgi:hypothetical protein